MPRDSGRGDHLRVTWLSNETPDVNGQGGQRRQFFQIRELVRSGCSVTVVTLAGPQSHESIERLARVHRIRTWVRGHRNPLAVATVAALTSRVSADGVVLAHEESWDLLWPWRRPVCDRLLVDFHNVTSAWHAARGEEEQAKTARELEQLIVSRARAVAVCSSTEGERLVHGGSASRVLLPHGFDPDEWPKQPPPADRPRVAAFGSWDWPPNRLGLEWFVQRVWKYVKQLVPTAEFLVAGSGFPAHLEAPGVSFVGRVPSLELFCRDAAVIVAPVLEGVGAPVKFAEALASGRAVLTTDDGGSAHPEAPAVISDDEEVWRATLERWLTDMSQAHSVGQQCRAWALESATWSAACRPLVEWVTAR